MQKRPPEQGHITRTSRLVLLIWIAILRPLSAGAPDDSGSVQELLSQLESRDVQERREAAPRWRRRHPSTLQPYRH